MSSWFPMRKNLSKLQHTSQYSSNEGTKAFAAPRCHFKPLACTLIRIFNHKHIKAQTQESYCVAALAAVVLSHGIYDSCNITFIMFHLSFALTLILVRFRLDAVLFKTVCSFSVLARVGWSVGVSLHSKNIYSFSPLIQCVL